MDIGYVVSQLTCKKCQNDLFLQVILRKCQFFVRFTSVLHIDF